MEVDYDIHFDGKQRKNLERLEGEWSRIKKQGRNIHGSAWGQVRKDFCLERSPFRELMKSRGIGRGLVIEENWKAVPIFI